MKLVQEIEQLLLEIETHYPELYQYLDEAPIKLTAKSSVSEDDLKEYLDDLKEKLSHYKETHGPSA